MKIRNPRSRFDLKINRSSRVLEVGGGHNPHPRSNVVVDKFIDSNYHRKTNIKVLKHQEFLQADGENLPFSDKEFDYVICNQVLEHTENPDAFLKEQFRVSKMGYIEVPSLVGEYLFPKESHRWLLLEIGNKLVMYEKEKLWFKTGLDLGYIFLTHLPRTSVGYKILMNTKPNVMTTRIEWKEDFEYLINPDDQEYLKYFTSYWNEEMVNEFFPHKGDLSEFLSSTKAYLNVFFRGIGGRYITK